jgi:hypothetical protein
MVGVAGVIKILGLLVHCWSYVAYEKFADIENKHGSHMFWIEGY